MGEDEERVTQPAALSAAEDGWWNPDRPWRELTPEQLAEIPPEVRRKVDDRSALAVMLLKQHPAQMAGLKRRMWLQFAGVSAFVILVSASWTALPLGRHHGAWITGVWCLTVGLVSALWCLCSYLARVLSRVTLPSSPAAAPPRSFAERVKGSEMLVQWCAKEIAADPEVGLVSAKLAFWPIERSPDGPALPLVEYLAENAPELALRERAAVLLPAIRDLAERQKTGQVLLRPAETQAEALLRPAEDDAALLRPREGTTDA